MTFSEMVQKTPNLYPTQIDEGLKETIFDWFQFRNVVDDNKFPVFFRRTLNDYYDTYNQLLRVEPGVAQYDWLVESYLERQVVVNATKTETLTSENEGSNSATRTDNTTQATTGTDTRNITNSGSDTTAGTEGVEGNSNVTHGGTTAVANAGTDTVTNSGSDVTSNTNTNTVDRTMGDTLTYNGSEENVRSGSYTDNDNLIYSQKQTTTTTQNGQHRHSTNKNDSGNSSATKQGPMDAGVTSNTDISGASAGSVNVSFDGHASAIAQTRAHDENTTEEYYSGNPDTVGVAENARTDQANKTVTYNNVTDTKNFNLRNDVRAVDEDITTTDNGTTTLQHGLQTATQHGLTSTTTHGETIGTTASTDTETNETTTYGKITNETLQKSESIQNTGTVTNAETMSNSGSTTSNGENASDTKEVLSGRHKEPAEVMEKVVSFIQRTHAWDWLRVQLEPCFMAVYDV